MLNVIIPMAGRGSRFVEAGYTFPKPLIEIGTPPRAMIQVVVENLGFRADYHYFVQSEHAKRYSFEPLLRLVTKPLGRAHFYSTDVVTGGQADSVLCVLQKWGAERLGEPVVVANSDQFMDGWHPGTFMDLMEREAPDCAICTFHGTHPKWSFAEVEPEGSRVLRTAEKEPISTRACVGVFYFRSAAELMAAIFKMKQDPAKQVRGEWYLAPAINELIALGKKVIEYPVPRMYGLGTPEDFQRFERLVEAGKVRV